MLIITGFSCKEKVPVYERGVNPNQAQTLLTQDVQCIDLRAKHDYDQDHLDGAVNIPFDKENFVKEIANFDRNKSVLIYCDNGDISKETLDLFKSNGFKQVYLLIGGYESWVNQRKF